MIKTYQTSSGIYKTGQMQSKQKTWYGKMRDDGRMDMITEKEFEFAIKPVIRPELDLPPF